MSSRYLGIRSRVERINADVPLVEEQRSELSDRKQTLLEYLETVPHLAVAGAGKLVENLVFVIGGKERLKLVERDLNKSIDILGAYGAAKEGSDLLRKAWPDRLRGDSTTSPQAIIPKEILFELHNVRDKRNAAIHARDPETKRLRNEINETTAESVLLQALHFLEWYFEHYYDVPDFYFPLPKTHPYNLPEPPKLVDRPERIKEVCRLLESNRLVTIWGPGGVGKTELAKQVARSLVDQYQDNVAYISFEHIASSELLSTPEYLPDVIATALGIKEEKQIKEALSRYLGKPHNFLLVIDNCEHLVKHCSPLIRFLLESKSCPRLYILATSLNFHGEPFT